MPVKGTVWPESFSSGRGDDEPFVERMWQTFREDCGHEFIPTKPFVPMRLFLSYGRNELVEMLARNVQRLLDGVIPITFAQHFTYDQVASTCRTEVIYGSASIH